MSVVRCDSGLMGWRAKLRSNYTSFEEFEAYAEIYGLHERLGFDSPADAWAANPRVQGSVNPSDFRVST